MLEEWIAHWRLPFRQAEPGATAERQVGKQLPPTRFGSARSDPDEHPAAIQYNHLTMRVKVAAWAGTLRRGGEIHR